MKTPLLSLALCCAVILPAKGQLTQQNVLNVSQLSAASAVIDVGPDSRTWANAQGGHPIVELVTGMNYSSNGLWVPSNPSFQISPDGTAFVANQVQHKVRLAANLNAIGTVTITTPDGELLQTTPVGIGLYNAANGDSLIIGAVTNCTGVLVNSNQVVYQNAFSGVSADVVITLNRGSFEQDVVFTGNINPAEWGFPTNSTRIQILTEFYNSPEPDEIVCPIYVEKNQALRNSMVSPDFIDHTLGFGEFVLAGGRAYTAGTNIVNAGAPIGKEFVTISGRTFLIESAQYPMLQPALSALPVIQVASTRSSGKAKNGYASIPVPHPSPSAVGISLGGNSQRMAQEGMKNRRGVVLDYNATIGGTLGSSTVLQGDTTYFVNGGVYCNGNVTIEGNAVFKYPTGNASIQLNNTLTLKTTSYMPAIFTAADDNSVGDTLNTTIWSGYTGTINSGGYANPALINNYSLTLSNVRFCYAKTAVQDGINSSFTISHSQFINCIQGIAIGYAGGSGSGPGSWMPVTMNNCLLNNVQYLLVDNPGGGGMCNFTNCTIDSSTQIIENANSVQLYFCNSVLANVGSLYNSKKSFNNSVNGNNNGFYSSPTFGSQQYTSGSSPFQTAGAGYHYLAADSPFRNVGTTSIGASLLAAIQQKTTYPPIVYSNVTFSYSQTLGPQVQRDNDTPDLGYHYDPVDYIADLLIVTNATLTLANGTAIACYNDSGIVLQDGSTVVSSAMPLTPNWFVRFSSVQEQPLLLGTNNPPFCIGVNPHPYGATGPTGQFRFTRFSAPAGGGYHLYNSGSQSYGNLLVQDCEFYSGTNYFNSTSGSEAIGLKNNLFWRSAIYASNMSSQVTLWLSNNLVLGTSLTLCQPSGGTWNAYNNDFDTCTIPSSSSLGNDYNAYINCSGRLSGTGGPDDYVSSTSIGYQSGPLGNYYQPYQSPASPLLGAGSTSPDQAGLFYYTVQTNQVTDYNNNPYQVSIGYHYVALDANGQPLDYIGNGIPDFIKDADGDGDMWINGTLDSGDLNPFDPYDLGFQIFITKPKRSGSLP
jgi:hypothetical protein